MTKKDGKLYILLLGFTIVSWSFYRESLNGYYLNSTMVQYDEIEYSHTFLNLTKYIDENIKQIKIFILPLYDGLNKTINGGHGECFDRSVANNNQAFVSFNTSQYGLDDIFYDRLRNDHSVLVSNVSHANILYVPIIIGEVCSDERLVNKLVEEFKQKYSRWYAVNKGGLSGKLLFFICSCPSYHTFKSMFSTRLRHSNKTVKGFDHTVHIATHVDYGNMMLVPFATKNKFTLQDSQIDYEHNEINEKRLVDILYCCHQRRLSNQYHKFVSKHIRVKTNLTFDEFKKHANLIDKPLVVIYTRGLNEESLEEMEWKLNSKLCIEVSDNVTQIERSFWDSIMLGCIPIILTKPKKLPFNDQIDYNRFVVQLNLTKFDKLNLSNLLKPYLTTKFLRNALEYLKQIRQFIQISWPFDEVKNVNPTFKYDAYGMILAKLGEHMSQTKSN